ncbi:uncharacterized protein LOC126814825 [Patella vulgata]|uniref:uncharacterized protein LOC126814825 n=1 Tax=Patella vulgata TaxID=6465 RepID=UPI00217FF929|nr:uncharacterized protein LOC126814825 [Patella vulgata]
MYSKVFFSDDSFNKFLENFEVDSTTHFVVSFNRNFNLTDPTNVDITKYRLRWSDTTTTPKVPYNGIPFIIIGHTVRACQNGPTAKPKVRKESSANTTYTRKRKLIQNSKKKGCEACIRCRKIITFPEYKIDGQPTKHLKFKKMKALTNNFSNAEKKLEIHAMFPSPCDHSNHPLGQLADFTQAPDEVVINKIHKLVEEGVRGIKNVKINLDTFVADYIHENFPNTKINKTNRRFYLTDRDIRNHVHLALSKLKKSELDKGVRCLQDEDRKTVVEIDDMVVTVDASDFYPGDEANPGEEVHVVVMVATGEICAVVTANPQEDVVLPVDTREICPVVAANSEEDVVLPVDTSEICPVVATKPGEDVVLPVDTSEICPVVATKPGEDVVLPVDTSEICPVVATKPEEDVVLPVDTSEICPVAAANSEEDVIMPVDTSEICPVVAANSEEDVIMAVDNSEFCPVVAPNPGDTVSK